jgi:glycine dehydrogenase
MYIRHDGRRGADRSDRRAILNANYIARQSRATISRVLYKGTKASSPTSASSTCAPGRRKASTVEDVAKRLMDYGYHAPTMSWPVAGTLDDRAD